MTKPDIFLSYSRDDQATARKFAEGFEHAGFSVWWDVTLKSGEDYDKVTEQALRSAKAVVVLWSKKSVESRWVRTEATIALQSQTLVPVMIEACQRPIMFELSQTADLSQWKGDGNDKTWLAFLNDVQHFVSKDSPQAAAATQHRASKKAWGLPAAGAAVLLLAAAGGYWLLNSGKLSTANTPADTKVASIGVSGAAVAATPEKSIAVLPFANLSDDTKQEYFADGLTDELINKLSQVQGLLVTGRNSSFYFKGKNDALRDIGQQLGVKHLLQGSVRKAGDQLRISAQLLDVDTNTNLWSKTFDRKLADIFAIQDEIAEAATTALSVTLRAGKFSDPAMTGNIEAYEAYMQARSGSFNGIDGLTTLDAIAGVEKAVSIDPNFALGWITLQYFYTNPTTSLRPSDRQDFPLKAQRALERAKALVPQHPALLQLDAVASMNGNRFAEAQAKIETLLNAASPDASANIVTARFLWMTGRTNEALRYAQQSRRLDPLSANGQFQLIALLLNQGRMQEARTEIASANTMLKDSPNLAGMSVLAAMQAGDKAAALKLLNARNGLTSELNTLTKVWEKQGDAAALQELHRIVNSGDLSANALVVFREIAAMLGDPELGLALLNKMMFTAADIWLPLYSGIRKQPGFKTWVRERGLLDYWRKSGKWSDFCRPLPNTESDFECF